MMIRNSAAWRQGYVFPASRVHHLGPSYVERPLILFAEDAADGAWEFQKGPRGRNTHLVVEWVLARDVSTVAADAVVPVLAVILFPRTRRAEMTLAVESSKLLHFRRHFAFDQAPGPDLDRIRAARMPYAQRREIPQPREIRKHRGMHPLDAMDPGAPKLLLHLGCSLRIIRGNLFIGREVQLAIAKCADAVSATDADLHTVMIIADRFAIALRDRGREMAGLGMIHVAGELLVGKLPIPAHPPFLDAANHLGAALNTIKHRVHVPSEVAQIIKQFGCFAIPVREYQALVG